MYKYMNNHFEVDRIFSKARFKVPNTNADAGGAGDSSAGTGGGGEVSGDENEEEKLGEPTIEELMAQLATEQAKNLRLQNERDTASKKAATYKKQLTAKMTAEEQLDEAKKEAEEAKERELNDIRAELSEIRATKRYMTLEMSEEKAEETAKAEIAGDMEKVIANIGIHIKELKKLAAEEALNKLLADRPDIKAGNGEGEGVSLAEEKAKEFASRKPGNVNVDALKRFM